MHARTDWPARLRKLMKARGIGDNPADLARATGLHYSVARRWLAGEGVPKIENLRAAAPGLGVPLVDLMVWSGLITEAEADQHVGAGERIDVTPEEALRADPTLTEEGKVAGLNQLELLRRAFPAGPPKSAARRRRGTP